MSEYWDLYDEHGAFLGDKVARGNPIPANKFHRVIHVWIINENKEYLIQKRSTSVAWHPDKWSTTTGSVLSGHFDLLEEAYRELFEELSLSRNEIDLEFLKEIIIGQSLVSIFIGFLPTYMIKNIVYNNEVSDVKWMSMYKIMELEKLEKFVPFSAELFNIIFKIKL
ncbi:MAG: NUDIX domain-containing protein [Chitinophagales bacterium]